MVDTSGAICLVCKHGRCHVDGRHRIISVVIKEPIFMQRLVISFRRLTIRKCLETGDRLRGIVKIHSLVDDLVEVFLLIRLLFL